VNERIRLVVAGFAVTSERYELFCECGRLDCEERFEVPVEIYDRACCDARVYVVRPGHEYLQADRVLAANDAYSIVFSS
jgi:hypothetical protein